MSAQRDTTSASSDASAHRRWLIGLTITVLFGIFGAVMAVLAYRNSTITPRAPARTTSPAPTESAPAAPTPDKPGRGKRHQ